MLYGDSPQHEFEKQLSFKNFSLFKPNVHKELHHTRKPNNKNFLFQVKDIEYVYVGEKVITFETNEKPVSYSSKHGFNDTKFAFAYDEKNVNFILIKKNPF